MAEQTFSVFVTGGTGYIGNPLIHALVERGYQVRALVARGVKRNFLPERK